MGHVARWVFEIERHKPANDLLSLARTWLLSEVVYCELNDISGLRFERLADESLKYRVELGVVSYVFLVGNADCFLRVRG
jgi:hypothetical protein